MRKNVLIYPGNGYPAEEVYFCLNNSLRYKPIIGNHGNAHCEFYAEEYYLDFPLISDEKFFEYINSFIKEKEISFIIPTHDTVADFLMKNENQIQCQIVCSNSETTDICRHKEKTYELFKTCDFVPKVYKQEDDMAFPVFIKDDVGQGGKNAHLIYNREELEEKLWGDDIQYVITEYLPGDEISIDCFTDRKGNLLFVQPRQRISILTGMSGRSQNEELTEEIEEMAKIINSKVNFRGYWYFQCKKDVNGKYKLLEISTRFAGTFCLSKNLDVNLPLLALTDAEDIDVRIFPNQYQIVGDRGYINLYKVNYFYERVYFDFDDTLVYNRKQFIVPAMAFLFQCINEGKEIVVLTRHAYDINQTLKDLHIDSKIFDKIIAIEDGKRKSDYIELDKPGIFIDNSFAERMEVKERLKIPTFDVCNLECLMKG